MSADRKLHWENVYGTKQPHEVSWTQNIPQTSLDFIRSFNLDKSARIIDVGGGDSKLVDFLVEEGYSNITVLDISSKALERAQHRLGDKAEMVHWIVSDILDFKPETTYDIWHDRAAFHFLTRPADIAAYIALATEAVSGFMILGTFSEEGPPKCSGLEVHRYSESELESLLPDFEKMDCQKEEHRTPFNTIQSFLYCSFQKKLL